jgi:hypothetical protein
MTFSRKKLDTVRGEIVETIQTSDESLLSEYPVEKYISFFDALRRPGRYGIVPNEAELFCQSIVIRTDLRVLEEYHRLALVVAMSQFKRRNKEQNITPRVRDYFEKYFETVMANMENPKKGYYLHKNDAFSKDFAVCRMKLWPCGVELVDECSGCPRSVLLKGGLKRFLTGLQFFTFRAGGFRPYYETHFHTRFIRDFTPEGYDRLYLTIAELLERNPEIKGMISSSWWHDPVLERISPKLRFLTQVPEDGGARSFCVGTNPVAVQDATRFSLERTKLYKEGKYTPKVYSLVWARTDLLQWAQQYGRQTA